MIPSKPQYNDRGDARLPPMSAHDAAALNTAARLAYERSLSTLSPTLRAHGEWDGLTPGQRDGWRLALLPLVSALQEFIYEADSAAGVDGTRMCELPNEAAEALGMIARLDSGRG